MQAHPILLRNEFSLCYASKMMEPHSVYVHIPFCEKRCWYCDFTTYAGMHALIPEYIQALKREIGEVFSNLDQPLGVHTIYFGGGTPSLVSPAGILEILAALRQHVDFCDPIEISLEANPGTLTRESLEGYRQAGVNRLSLGIQSANADELQILGRIHTIEQSDAAVQDARTAGFENINLDLIYGLPGQRLDRWKSSLDQALAWEPEHLSLYALTLEESTPMAASIRKGELPALDDDFAADAYELAMERLEKEGYLQYEISNWAAQDEAASLVCRHNLQYWRNLPYLGLGVGAHGYAGGYRTVNVDTMPVYIGNMRTLTAGTFPFSSANQERRAVGEQERRQDAMMLGLRLTEEGIARSQYTATYHHDFYEIHRQVIDRLVQQGLLEWTSADQETIRLTRKGRLVGNQVFLHFVGED